MTGLGDLGDLCPCGHPEIAHLTEDEAAELGPLTPRMCVAVAVDDEDDPEVDTTRVCPCWAWRPRTPAPLAVRSINAILRRLG